MAIFRRRQREIAMAANSVQNSVSSSTGVSPDNPFDGAQGPPPAAVTAVLDLLGVADEGPRKAHARFLVATVRSFEFKRAYRRVFGSDHEAIHQLRKLSLLIEAVEDGMRTLRPDIQALIQHLEQPPYSSDDWRALTTELGKLGSVLARSKGTRLPARRPDKHLDETVAFLMLRLKDITGTLAHARPADSRYKRPARLASREADAIWMLLQHIDEITESVVANRIVALERRHRDQLEAAYPNFVLVGGTVRPISAHT